MTDRHRQIVNVDDVQLEPRPAFFKPNGDAAERFDARTARLGPVVGAKKLGFSITAVPPGKSAFPAHAHRVNEELFFVLEGSGEVRLGAERYPIRKGDLISCPPGGAETAHQLINTGAVELKYIAISTAQSPEIVEYPDSKKFGVLALIGEDPLDPSSWFRFFGRHEAGVNYWDGE